MKKFKKIKYRKSHTNQRELNNKLKDSQYSDSDFDIGEDLGLGVKIDSFNSKVGRGTKGVKATDISIEHVGTLNISSSKSKVNSRKSGTSQTSTKHSGCTHKEVYHMEKCSNSQRIKKGMVFWYNIDSSVCKEGLHYSNGVQDSALYGKRPWIVVSSDSFNTGGSCSIVPTSTGKHGTSDRFPSRIDLTLCGRDTCILVNQIRYVNCDELTEYMTFMNKNVMNEIDKKLSKYLGIQSQIVIESESATEAFNRVVGMLDYIITSKTENEDKNRVATSSLEEAIQKLGDKLVDRVHKEYLACRNSEEKGSKKEHDESSSLSNHKHELPITRTIDLKDSNVSNTIPKSIKVREAGIRAGKKRGLDYWEQVLEDFNCLSEKDFMEKYGVKNTKSYQNRGYYAKQRVAALKSKL